MNSYADYTFYIDNYHGNCIKSADEFKRLVIEASGYLNQITLGRIKEPTDEVKIATCAIADVCYRQSKADTEKDVASESVGPHSITYVKKTKTYEDYQREKLEKARLYLANTGLLYRGVASCNL